MQDFCDFLCPYAMFPKDNSFEGACRRERVIYCKLLNQLVLKNAPCKAIKLKKGERDGDKGTFKKVY